MRAGFHPHAKEELSKAVAYYEKKKSDLGNGLLEAVMAAVGLIEEHLGVGRELDSGVRQVMIRRYPYSLLYSHSGASLMILAVAHNKRRPDYWLSRLHS